MSQALESPALCATCGAAIDGGTRCAWCWEVEHRLDDYLRRGGHKARAVLAAALAGTEPARPDFRAFAFQLRDEARWSGELHSKDTTGRAASDQRKLRLLADHVDLVGKELGL